MSTGTPWTDIVGGTNYLSGDDFNTDERKTLTIKSAGNERVDNPVTRKSEYKLVVHFHETVRPMIFNKINSRRVHRIARTNIVESWPGTRINVFFDPTVKFGKETPGGLRVDPVPPPQPVTCSDCSVPICDTEKATADQIVTGTKKTYGAALCLSCAQIRKGSKNDNE